MTNKDLKLLGSRIGKGSKLILTGDFKQADGKFASDSGIQALIEKAKGDPLVSVVYLPEDVRSDASKVFADL